jgi:hypothetical protein
MGRGRHSVEQIIGKLREAEVLQGKGIAMEEIMRQLAISDATYYKWRKEHGGLRVDQAKRLKELEQENSQLRKVSHMLPTSFDKLQAGRVVSHHMRMLGILSPSATRDVIVLVDHDATA